MAILFVLTGWNPAPWKQAIAKLAPERDVRWWPEVGDPADIEYALVWKPPHGALQNMPNLKAIMSMGAGVDFMLDDPTLPDVPLGRIIDPNLTMRMTEYVVFQVLLHHRQHLALAEAQRNKFWYSALVQPAAADVRVGVMGLGVLGSDAAEKLSLLGFQVAGWSRTPKQIDGVQCFAGEAEFKSFLNRTDILVCLMPHTPETNALLNAAAFRELARDGKLQGPAFINAGRGKIQVEKDILAALDNGDLHAASLDVFETEPLAPTSPLWTHPQVVITPHNASDSEPEAVTVNILKQINGFERTGTLDHAVDLKRGY